MNVKQLWKYYKRVQWGFSFLESRPIKVKKIILSVFQNDQIKYIHSMDTFIQEKNIVCLKIRSTLEKRHKFKWTRNNRQD